MKPFANLLRLFLFLLLSGLFSGCSKENLLEVTFPKGLEAHLVPVTFELPQDFKDTAAVWEIFPPECLKAKRASGQTWVDYTKPGSDKKRPLMVTFLWDIGDTPGGKTIYYLVRRAEKVQPAFSFEERKDGELTLVQSGSPVLTYIYGLKLKEGVPEDRRRSSYVHPVYGLDGEVLSDDFPQDHYHHRGIFWTWPEVFVGSDSVSLWDIRGIYQRFERWLGRESGPVFARFGVENGWYIGEKKVVDEKVWITAYRAGEIGRILDFEFAWEALEKPVTLLGAPEENKGYGGFSLRFAPFAGPVITTPGGVQNEDTNLMPFPWADLSARFGGSDKLSGAAIFDNSRNIGFPNGWTLRHYGFLGVAWPGNNPYTLQPGQPVRASYRVWLHRNNAEDGLVSSAYLAYSEPPKVKYMH